MDRSVRRLAGLGALAALVVLVACTTPAGRGGGAAGGTPDGAVAPAAQSVARLTIGIPADGGPLNVYTGSADNLIELVFDKLFAPSPFVERPEPWLAESATQTDDRTWVIKLRQGVLWHDGMPFGAADVKFTFESYRDGEPNRHTHHVSEVPRIDQIEVLDELTVRFVCGYPCPSLGRITLADLPILPKHIWEPIKAPRLYTALPVGTGPYQLVEYLPQQLYRFRANERYFKGRPVVEELVLPVMPDQSATFTALRTGQIDAAARKVPPELLAEFGRQRELKVAGTSLLSIVQLGMSYQKAPFDRPEFRRALSLAVDRKALVDTVLLGQGRPGTRGYPHPDSPWTSPRLQTPSDPAQARRLLDELGYRDRDGDGMRETPDGAPMPFTLAVASTEPTWTRIAELVAKQAAAVGLKVTVRSLDSAALDTLRRAGGIDLLVSEIGPHGAADPDQFIMSHRSGYLWDPKLPYPEMEALFEEWRRAATVDSRKEVAFRMQELFNRQPTYLALYYPQEHWAYRPAAFDRWAESPGFGIVSKWSFLPAEVRRGAITREFR